jgi:aminopeptidase N
VERLVNYFVPERYNVDLKIDKRQKTIGGVVKVVGEALAETVKFHAVGLEITDVTVNGKKAKYVADGELLTIEKVPIEKCDIEIHYNGKLNENMEGAYLSTYELDGKTETIVATQFESHYAREAFP